MSICAMSTEESRVKEELGRPSLADSSSSLSILSAGLWLLVGFFVVFFIQIEYVFICMYPTLSRLTQEGSDTPKLVTPVSLAEGRQEQICPTQLNCGYLSKSLLVGWLDTFLLMSTALCESCCWRKINKAEPCKQVPFELPESLGGNFRNTLQRDGQASSLRSSVRLA